MKHSLHMTNWNGANTNSVTMLTKVKITIKHVTLYILAAYIHVHVHTSYGNNWASTTCIVYIVKYYVVFFFFKKKIKDSIQFQ